MWLKGNAAGERAAWLIYDESVKDKVKKLLKDPLEAGGFFDVTATLDNTEDILTRYMQRREIEVIGKLDFPEISLGSKEPPKVAGAKWWEEFPWEKGFWYPSLKLGGKQTYHHIRAKGRAENGKEPVFATSHMDARGPMLCLHGYEEIAVSYRGRDPPSIYAEKQEDMWFWETHLQKIIAERVSLQQVLEAEPAWQQFQDTVKLPE
jgi:hypothetical protein